MVQSPGKPGCGCAGRPVSRRLAHWRADCRTPLGRRARISGCSRAGTRVRRVPQTANRIEVGTRYSSVPSPIVCLYYYPSLVLELFSVRSSIHAWWRDGRLARLAGGDARRSIDVATGRDEHFLSWIRHAISSAFVRTKTADGHG